MNKTPKTETTQTPKTETTQTPKSGIRMEGFLCGKLKKTAINIYY